MACNITAVVTAYRRIEQTLATVKKIKACDPRPDEILVHVDANQVQCEIAIRQAFPDVTILRSNDSIGPGGGRNKLIAGAKNEIVASFDDDSYPLDLDYFSRIKALFEMFPEATVLCAQVYHLGETLADATYSAQWVSDFIGCGCVYRRSSFLATEGYVPLPIAYDMEEVDLAIRLHAVGGKILRSPWLRVFHDTDRKRHASPQITASSIANLALRAYLRYPVVLWILGVGQVFSRIIWLIKHGRFKGIITGLSMIPSHIFANRQYRQCLNTKSVISYLRLRRFPIIALR